MAGVLRGEVHWADLNPVMGAEQAGLRPVVVLQSDAVNKFASTTIALAITSAPQRAGYPLTVRLRAGEGGLPKPSWVKLTQVRTLALARLKGRLGRLGDKRLRQLEQALLEVLDIIRGD